MRKTFKTLLLALLLALAGITAAQADNASAEGRWRQIDPDTHRAKSIVEISRTSNGAASETKPTAPTRLTTEAER